MIDLARVIGMVPIEVRAADIGRVGIGDLHHPNRSVYVGKQPGGVQNRISLSKGVAMSVPASVHT